MSTDLAVVFFFVFIDLYIIAAVRRIIIRDAGGADIGNQQAAPCVAARRIAKYANAEAAFLFGGILVLTGDEGCAGIVNVLNGCDVDRINDQCITSRKVKGR